MKRNRGKNRQGAVLVEFAITVPVMFLLIFGSIQIANSIFLKQFVTEVAYHTALTGIRPDATEQELITAVEDMMDQHGVSASLIEIKGPNGLPFDSTAALSPFSVRIRIGSDQDYRGPDILNPFDVEAVTYAYRL